MAAASAFLWSACGSEQVIEAEGEAGTLSCASDRDQVVELLRSGLPSYDYDPAPDLAALIEASDVVLAGTVGSVGRVVGEPDPDFGDDSWTVLSVQSPEVLHVAGDIESPTQFSYATLWPEGVGADPLAAGISVDGLAFVAFLEFWEPAPGTLVADVQGLVVDCVDGSTATPVIEPLPGDAVGLSLMELARSVEVIGGESVAGVTVEPGRPLGEQQSEPGPAEVKLWVSNQSFADDPVQVTVALGDLTVIDERFEVRGQHNWVAFDIKGLEPGVHKITAESDTGATLTADFTVLADEPRWLVLDYWYYPEDVEGRHFTFVESDEPVAFA